jgi:hypothetical protein
VVGDREQAVGVRGEVDADDLGLLVDHMVDEPRVLVREPVAGTSLGRVAVLMASPARVLGP